MKKVSRSISLIIIIAFVLSIAVGCNQDTTTEAGTGETTTQQTNEEVDSPELASKWTEFSTPRELTISWFEQGWTGLEEAYDLVTPKIQERTNLNIGYEAVVTPTGDDYTQRLNLMVASDEVPDVFFGGNNSYTRTIYSRLGENGKIWELSNIVSDYEYLYDLVFPEMNLYRTANDENYFVPTQTGRGNELLLEAPHGLSVRVDFLEALELDFPTTPDELYTYLKRSIEELTVNDQRVIGLVLEEDLGGLHNLYDPFFPLVGEHATHGLPFDYQNDFQIVNYSYTDSPELLEAALYIHKLASEGLIDAEALTIRQAQVQERISSGRVAAATSPWWDMNTFSDIAKENVSDLMFAVTPPIYASSQIQQTREREWTNWVGCWSSLIISTDIDEYHLRHLLAVMDYMATEEGQLLVQAGIEDETFFWNDEEQYEFTPEFIEATNDLDWNRSAAHGVFYYSQLVFNVPVISHLQATPPSLIRADNHLGWENQESRRALYNAELEPPVDYYFLPGEKENQNFSAIQNAQREFWAQILAAGSESEVENLVSQWGEDTRNLGIEEIMQERQDYIDNFKIVH